MADGRLINSTLFNNAFCSIEEDVESMLEISLHFVFRTECMTSCFKMRDKNQKKEELVFLVASKPDKQANTLAVTRDMRRNGTSVGRPLLPFLEIESPKSFVVLWDIGTDWV